MTKNNLGTAIRGLRKVAKFSEEFDYCKEYFGTLTDLEALRVIVHAQYRLIKKEEEKDV